MASMSKREYYATSEESDIVHAHADCSHVARADEVIAHNGKPEEKRLCHNCNLETERYYE